MSSIIYNGQEIQDLIVNGNQAQLWLNGQKLYPSGGTPVDPYNPLGLPPFTIRCKFSSGYTPTMGDSQTLVDQVENVWDITKNSEDWTELFKDVTQLENILGANTTGVTTLNYTFRSCTQLTELPLFDTSYCTSMKYGFLGCFRLVSLPLFDTSSCTNMYGAFQNCSSLTTVPLFDTSHVTNMITMFWGCESLKTIPLLNTSSVTTTIGMFEKCNNVESGALALYQQMSTQTNPPGSHKDTFLDCGRDTVTGAAELAQIPTSWGGTMA